MSEPGSVYIFHNCEHRQPSVKIGMTTQSVKARAKKLHTTGSPSEFVPLFSLLVSDCRKVEQLMHDHFDEFRKSPTREFFAVTPETAIRALMRLGAPFAIEDLAISDPPGSIDVLDKLKERYAGLLDSRLTSASIGAYEGTVILSCTYSDSDFRADSTVKRIDLNVISSDGNGDSPLFTPGSLDNAASTFLSLDPYTYIMTTPLFENPESQLIANLVEGRRDKFNKFDDSEVLIDIISKFSRDLRGTSMKPDELVAKYVRS
jgi:hypothetical protein